MTELTKLETLEKAVVYTKSDTVAAAYANLAANSVLDDAITAQKRAKQELKDYRNYKKAQLIQQLAEIVIRHDIETT